MRRIMGTVRIVMPMKEDCEFRAGAVSAQVTILKSATDVERKMGLFRRCRLRSIAIVDHGGIMIIGFLEPPSCNSTRSTVFVGKDCRGNCVAIEQKGTFGGLFVSRAQVFKFARLGNRQYPETIVEVTSEIELDISSN